MLPELSLEEVRAFRASAPHPPLLPVVEESAGILMCPVCLLFKPEALLAHIGCDRIVCADCCVYLLDHNGSCPICREHLLRTSGASLRKLTPTELEYASRVLFYCSNCESEMDMARARKHIECQMPLIRQLPSHIPFPREPTTIRFEVASNPPAPAASGPGERLLIIRLDGRQVLSRFYPSSYSIMRVERDLARYLGTSPTNYQ